MYYSEMVKIKKSKEEKEQEERHAHEFVKQVQAREMARRQHLENLKQREEIKMKEEA
eukprot:CAMPEP_0202966948 /NCGR_PEP_ID=MMETSP1396-20130829/11621_1 /ASSEMBLY_ACC=CAM_ASM_000872 /TAXON_ID= /ORGANISM="Pseudokeronopsis sp., Strain Brazil" /LENGTH=56 /DNA_ID=CAMNT_0049691429 /DNA_START=325 /DNA_END=495 /DNA_ORIENTATION=+